MHAENVHRTKVGSGSEPGPVDPDCRYVRAAHLRRGRPSGPGSNLAEKAPPHPSGAGFPFDQEENLLPISALPGVSSNDPALEAAVTEWLGQSRMPLPDGLRLRLEVVDSVGEWEDPREVFPQGDVEIRAGEPLGWVQRIFSTSASFSWVVV